jgi:hypothetical protein
VVSVTLEELLLASEHLSEVDKLKLIQSLKGNLGEDESKETEVDLFSEIQEQQPGNDSIDSSSNDQPKELSQSLNSGEFNAQGLLSDTEVANQYSSTEKIAQPSLLGFHTHGLIATVLLDCLWMVLEVGTGGFINLLVFVIFGITSYIVFTKQRLLGDSRSIALTKAIFLGVIAGFPTSFTGLFLFGFLKVLSNVIPTTEKFSVKLATAETVGLGEFMSEFKQLETLFAQSVGAVDPKAVHDKFAKNVEFMGEKELISGDLLVLLKAVGKIRNNVVHGSDTTSPRTFTNNDLQILRQCKIAAEKALKR